MAAEFVRLNSRIVNMKPDDILRGLESSYPNIAKLRKACPYVGYDRIRQSERSPILSMSAVLRCWKASAGESPRAHGSATDMAVAFNSDDLTGCIGFLQCAFTAWGRDANYSKLWSALNLTICMWLYRRLVLSAYSAKTRVISNEQFAKCLMSVSAAEFYVEWLLGRTLSPTNLSPAYQKVKGAFDARLERDTLTKHMLPAPSWAKGGGGKKK